MIVLFQIDKNCIVMDWIYQTCNLKTFLTFCDLSHFSNFMTTTCSRFIITSPLLFHDTFVLQNCPLAHMFHDCLFLHQTWQHQIRSHLMIANCSHSMTTTCSYFIIDYPLADNPARLSRLPIGSRFISA